MSAGKLSMPAPGWWVASWDGQTVFAYAERWVDARDLIAEALRISKHYAGIIAIPATQAEFFESDIDGSFLIVY